MKRFLLMLFVLLSMAAVLMTSCGKNDGGDSEPRSNEMPTVTGITYNAVEKKISWNAVDGAAKYRVTVGNNSAEVDGVSYTYDANEQNFSVSIVALPDGDGKKTESKPAAKSFSLLSKVQNIMMQNGSLIWDPVASATYYDVYLNGTLAKRVNTNRLDDLIPNTAYIVYIVPGSSGSDTVGFYGVESNHFEGMVLAKPILQFENSTTTIYWDGVDGANGYRLTVSLDGQKIVSETIGHSTTAYRNEFMDAGKYVIEIQTISDKSRTDCYDSAFSSIEITRLPCVGDVRTSYPMQEANNTVYLSFNDVPGATGFDVREANITLKQIERTVFEYTFVRSVDEINKDIRIYTKGDGDRILDSYTGKQVILTKLAMPKNIKVNNGLIVWDAVNKCDGYRITIDGVEYHANTNQLETPPLEGGAHVVRIAALGNEGAIVTSDFSNEVSIIKLYKPQNLQIVDNVLYWDNVQYSESYNVQIGDLVQNVSTNSFAIDERLIGESTTIKVTAVSSGDHILPSNYSETVPLFRLQSPTNLKTNNDYVSWSAVPNADHYLVFFNNVVKKVTGESYAWEEFPAKDYLVKVVAVGDGKTYFTSPESAQINVKKLDAPVINVSEKGFVWDKVAMADSYEFLNEGEITRLDGMTLFYRPTYTSGGNKQVQIRALGDGVKTVASSWVSYTHNVAVENDPGSFTVTKNGSIFTVTVDSPEDGKKYLFNISGTVKEGEVSQSVQIMNAGTMNVSIATKGDGFFTIDSPYTYSKQYYILSAVEKSSIIFYDEGNDYYTVSWKGVSNASGYTIKIQKTTLDNKVEEEIIREKNPASTNHGIDMYGYKSVKITIIARGDGLNYFDSVEVVTVFSNY